LKLNLHVYAQTSAHKCTPKKINFNSIRVNIQFFSTVFTQLTNLKRYTKASIKV